MSAELHLALALAVATGTAYLLTPVAIQAAGRFDFYDKPKGYKGHAKPIPYLGGGAVLAAFVVAVLLLAGDLDRTLPLLAGVAILWLVGTIDDRRHLSPGLRVLIEIGLAAGLWVFDVGWDLGAGAVIDLIVTVVWVLAVVNAFNLFDNMDGASTAMALVVSAAVAVLGVIQADPWLTTVGAALAGSCLGFLPYNLARPQAKIFLGDGGSMPIGFAVAAIVMAGASAAASSWEAIATGLLLVGVPAADTALVIISRRRKGISVLTGGRDHLTHRTRRRLGTARSVAVTLGALQAVIASVALVALDVGPSAIITATVIVLAVAGAVITLLEREEDRLLAAGELFVPDEALDAARAKRISQPDPITIGDLALVTLALGAALSPFWDGFYASSAWVPLGLGLTLIAAMGAIRRPQRLPLPAWLALAGLVGIGLFGLLSARWAPSADLAVTMSNRWLVLAIVLGLGLILMRTSRRDVVTTVALATGTFVVAGSVLARMLGSDGSALFLAGRLHEPLGYINAEATVFLMGAWLWMAAAERREAWLAGLGLGGATAMVSLSLLSASRGAAIAAIAATILVLLAVPGRQRRAFALLVLGAGVAFAAGPLFEVYDAAQAAGGAASDDLIRRAARSVIVAALLAGIVWSAGTAFFERSGDATRRGITRLGHGLLWVAVAGAVIGGLATAGPISDRISRQWTAFSDVAQPGEAAAVAADGGSRLVSGSGNRHEYWRVAWDAFQDRPLQGVGAGNFERSWFANRTITEDVRQPHSIELQVLSEEGLIGGALLLLLLGGFALGVARVHRVAVPGLPSGGVAVAAVGVPATWLAHTSVDWQHLIPGTNAVALVMLAVLLRQPDRTTADATPLIPDAADDPVATTPPLAPGPVGALLHPATLAGAIVIALVVATVGATLTRQAFADHYREAAFQAINRDAALAIVQADRALRLNGDATRSYYAKAAALARMNRGRDAAAVLREATRRDPTNPVTWALLGDLATRRGQPSAAQRFYARALSLNPLDPGLQALAGRSGAPR